MAYGQENASTVRIPAARQSDLDDAQQKLDLDSRHATLREASTTSSTPPCFVEVLADTAQAHGHWRHAVHYLRLDWPYPQGAVRRERAR